MKLPQPFLPFKILKTLKYYPLLYIRKRNYTSGLAALFQRSPPARMQSVWTYVCKNHCNGRKPV